MDILVPDRLLELLMISMTLSIFIMAFLQKLKGHRIIKKNYHIWIGNFLLSFAIGIPFGLYFYSLSIYDTLWISFFSFLGAPTIYQVLKKQNIVNYTPKSIDDCCSKYQNMVCIPKENVIERRDIL